MLPEVKLEDPIDFDTESGIGANDSSTAASIQVPIIYETALTPTLSEFAILNYATLNIQSIE